MPCHPRALLNMAWGGASANGTWRAHTVGSAVRLLRSMEPMALDGARESTAFGNTAYIHILTLAENVGLQDIALFVSDFLHTRFLEVFHRLQTADSAALRVLLVCLQLAQMAQFAAREPAWVHRAKTKLYGAITFFLNGFD